LVAWLVALLLLTMVTRLPLLRLNQPIDDEVVYGVAAQTIVDGGVPYINAVERKPPLLFYVYAAVLKTFGSDNWRALHITEVVWIFATMAALVVIGRKLFDTETGLIAALLYSIFQAWSYWNNLAFNGEVLMNLPLAWAFAIAFSSVPPHRLINVFIAGALVAVAFLLKQPAAIAIVPLALFVIPTSAATDQMPFARVLIRLVVLMLGLSVVLLAMAGWLSLVICWPRRSTGPSPITPSLRSSG
jgi:4-amino-4-deoxy-L-arabinose transferase-like glycosyltransferase